MTHLDARETAWSESLDTVNFEAVASSSLLAHDVPVLLSVWTMLQEKKVLQEFEAYLEQHDLERKGTKSTTKLGRNIELVVRVTLNKCLVEAVEPWAASEETATDAAESTMLYAGTKSNCQFQLTAPTGLSPGPRNGFIEVWKPMNGAAKGRRVCRFAFSVKVSASLAYLEYLTQDDAAAVSAVDRASLREPVEVTLSYDQGTDTGIAGRVAQAIEHISKRSTFDIAKVPLSSGRRGNDRVWWCTKAQQSTVVIPVLSDSFFASQECRDELTFARNEGKVIVPVLAEPFDYGRCPLDCRMMLQGTNRIPSNGCFADNFDSNVQSLVRGMELQFSKVNNERKATRAVSEVLGSSSTDLDDDLDRAVDVVLSYRTKDSKNPKGGEKLMWRIAERLEQVTHGITGDRLTTFNGKQVPAGGNWRTWWCTKAQRSTVVIPILSPSFFESEACRDELTFAKNEGKVILPVVAEEFSACPPDCRMILQSLPVCDLSSGDIEQRFESVVQELIDIVREVQESEPERKKVVRNAHSVQTMDTALLDLHSPRSVATSKRLEQGQAVVVDSLAELSTSLAVMPAPLDVSLSIKQVGSQYQVTLAEAGHDQERGSVSGDGTVALAATAPLVYVPRKTCWFSW